MQKSSSKIVLIAGALVSLAVLFFFIKSAPKSEQTHKQTSITEVDSGTKVPEQTMQATEKKFLLSMIPHHEEAVDTSKYVLSQTKDAELRDFLIKVIAVQTAEIEQMKSAYKLLIGEDYKPDGQYEPMMGELQSLSGLLLEKSYVQGMIAHHQGAISMAKKIVEFGESSTLASFAQGIIDAQRSEVTLMQRWLDGKYNNVQLDTAKPAMHMMMR